jgi:predicted Zn-dependent protease
MEAGEGGAGSIDFLSTHPASGKRVQKVEKWAKEIIEMRPESCGPLERQWGAFREASTTKSRW